VGAERVLVTGAAGSLGREVCAELSAAGKGVVGFDQQAPDSGTAAATEAWTQGDIRDAHQLLGACLEHRIDTIVHLAAVLAPLADRDPSTGFSVNVGGMLNVLETARALKLRKVVWASSAGIFSGLPRDRLIANDSPVAPINIYQATKVACEVLAGHYSRTFGVDSVGLRWPTLLSIRPSGGRAAKIGEELITKPLSGRAGTIDGGDDVLNWLWIGDAARAVGRAVDSGPLPALAYNVSGDIRPMRDAVRIMRELIPDAEIAISAGTLGLNYPMDASAVKRDLGFEFETNLEAQLRELTDRMRTVLGRGAQT
jgi:nucleoside-diphosphate-sugar epimerase